jgi:hypothetical protein
MEPYKWCYSFSDAAAALAKQLKNMTATEDAPDADSGKSHPFSVYLDSYPGRCDAPS